MFEDCQKLRSFMSIANYIPLGPHATHRDKYSVSGFNHVIERCLHASTSCTRNGNGVAIIRLE